MAERRPPGFNVDLGFYDSPEVLSIPRKHRAAAVGVWTLCGAYAANKLTDGLVTAEKLRELGCTPAIKAVLMATEPEPLWVTGDQPGAIQFTRWPKWQRTNAEVKAYRDADAERKRLAREAKKKPTGGQPDANQAPSDEQPSVNRRPSDDQPPHNQVINQGSDNHVGDSTTSANSEVSERTTVGRPKIVRADSGTPKTETETETESLSTSLTLVEGGPGGDPKLSVAAKPAPGADTKRGSRLPEGWRPADDTITAMREQFPHADLDAIRTEFADYWRGVPGARGRKLDWDATWRNRVRETAARNPIRNGQTPRAPNGSTVDRKVDGWLNLGKPTQREITP